MSKVDFEEYVLQVQSDYHDMLNIVNKLKDELKRGMTDEETVNRVVKDIEDIKSKYDTATYFDLLLNKPRKSKKQLQYEQQHKHLYPYLSKVTLDVVKWENYNSLNDLKEVYKLIHKEEGEE